jgi:hypothetical protein
MLQSSFESYGMTSITSDGWVMDWQEGVNKDESDSGMLAHRTGNATNYLRTIPNMTKHSAQLLHYHKRPPFS